MWFAPFVISQSNSRHSISIEYDHMRVAISRILNSPTCMTSHVCISMHMHNSFFISSCMIILIESTCVKAYTWHVFPTPLNLESHLSMGLDINSSRNSHFCMNMQYFASMTHGEYFCLGVKFWSSCMTWVQSLHPCFPLSLRSSLSHDVLSPLSQSNCSISQDLLLLAQIMFQSQFVAMP